MIIDTNIYGALKKESHEVLSLVAKDTRLGIPLPVISELKYGFINGIRTAYNQMILEEFLAQQLVEVLLPSLATCDIYADLYYYAKQRGKSLSHNDIWIASLARDDGDVLVTYDKDFAVFQDLFSDKLLILS